MLARASQLHLDVKESIAFSTSDGTVLAAGLRSKLG